MYIEFKETTESLTRWIIETLRRAHMLDRAILFSSRPDHVFFAKKVDPKNVRTAFSYRQSGIDPILMAQACHADGLNLAWEDYLHPYMHITPAWLTRVRAAGLRLMSWHEERERELRELIRLGIDDVCTNDPALAHKLIEEISGT